MRTVLDAWAVRPTHTKRAWVDIYIYIKRARLGIFSFNFINVTYVVLKFFVLLMLKVDLYYETQLLSTLFFRLGYGEKKKWALQGAEAFFLFF